MWADDAQKTVEFLHDKHLMRLPIMTLQTPGHTPDSLSWWDDDERVLYVGDMLYEQESADSRAAPWEREDPAPILFPNEGDLSLWWWNLNRLIKFVEARNKEGLDRVKLSAGHVTANVDALACLMAAKDFMTRILRDEVDFREQPIKRGERFGHWSDRTSAFSLGAPLRVIEEGRLKIPQKEWMAFNKHIKTEVWSAI
jgi:glyoxylase-like metal-dependent hydrolase (beta-lactamase superfamily II)